MAPLAKLKPLALDSNLPLDLAADLDAAHTFREVFLERGYRLFVPPTIVPELTLLAEEESDSKKSALALKALQSLRGWDIEPYDLKSVEHGIAGEFARRLMAQGLLPDRPITDPPRPPWHAGASRVGGCPLVILLPAPCSFITINCRGAASRQWNCKVEKSDSTPIPPNQALGLKQIHVYMR